MSTLKVAAINNPSASSGGLAISASGNVTGAGLDLITTQSFSAVSSVSVNNCFTATYDNYVISFRGARTTGASDVFIRMRVSGTDATTNYVQLIYGRNETTTTSAYEAAQTQGKIIWCGTTQGAGSIHLFRPFIAAQTLINSVSAGWGGFNAAETRSVIHDTSTSYDGFTLSTATTMTGTVSVYGLRN